VIYMFQQNSSPRAAVMGTLFVVRIDGWIEGRDITREAPPTVRRCDGGGSNGPSSGHQQVILKENLEVPIADVRRSQDSVCIDTFDAPGGKCNVFDVMLELRLKQKLPDWPPIRIARCDLSGVSYLIDNRRLFMHKTLGNSLGVAMIQCAPQR